MARAAPLQHYCLADCHFIPTNFHSTARYFLTKLTLVALWRFAGMEPLVETVFKGAMLVTVRTGLYEVAMLDAGDSHTIALTARGAVYGWGTYRDATGVYGFAPDTKYGLRPTLVWAPAKSADQAVKIASGTVPPCASGPVQCCVAILHPVVDTWDCICHALVYHRRKYVACVTQQCTTAAKAVPPSMCGVQLPAGNCAVLCCAVSYK